MGFFMRHLFIVFALAVAAPAIASGQLDPSFADGGIRIMRFDAPQLDETEDYARDGLIDSQGRYVSAGVATPPEISLFVGQITRHLPSGERDLSLQGTGYVRFVHPNGTQGSIAFNSIAEQEDGKLVAAGVNDWNNHSIVCRLNVDGSRDESFGPEGCQEHEQFGGFVDVVIRPDGRILLLADAPPAVAAYALLQLDPQGQADAEFGACGGCGYALSPDFIKTSWVRRSRCR